MKTLVSGENIQVAAAKVRVQVQYNHACDVSTFCLYANNKTKGDDDFIFYGQTANQARTVVFEQGANSSVLTIDLQNLAADISKVALTVSYEDQKISTIGDLTLNATSDDTGLFAVNFATANRDECALILGEFYRYKGSWKFKAIDQGFNGGLQPLAEYYGVEISEGQSKPAQAPTSIATGAQGGKVSLSKDKPRIDLAARANFDLIKVNLNWNRGPFTNTDNAGFVSRESNAGFVSREGTGGGFLAGLRDTWTNIRDSKLVNDVSNSVSGFVKKFTKNGIDLDLAAYIQLQDGEKTIIQALGNRFGSLENPPYVKLLGDDRTGQQEDGEWLHINGQAWSKIKEIVIFTFIYQGVPNWAATDAQIKIYINGEPEITTQLTEGDDHLPMCAIARFQNQGGQLIIERINRYFLGHQDMDHALGWGLPWTRGSK
ncbi:MAG: TerD family protein [Desulfovibrionaceae bacterium]|nr:TerD family protein [Desulfovibrionaceae bacterium]